MAFSYDRKNEWIDEKDFGDAADNLHRRQDQPEALSLSLSRCQGTKSTSAYVVT